MYFHLLSSINFSGLHLACERCPDGFTTSIAGATNVGDCSLPICQMGSYLNSTLNKCQLCPKGKYQDQPQETLCKPCPTDTSTQAEGNIHFICTYQCFHILPTYNIVYQNV